MRPGTYRGELVPGKCQAEIVTRHQSSMVRGWTLSREYRQCGRAATLEPDADGNPTLCAQHYGMRHEAQP